MKILYIATSFPKPEKGSTIYTDLAEELVRNGHNVTVVVSEEKKNTQKTCVTNERGCGVLRVKTGNYYDVSFVEKGLTFITMEYVIKLAIHKHLKNNEYDVILFESPPVTNAGIVKYAKRKFNAKTYLMLKDIFPQNAVDLDIMKKNGIIYNFFKMKEKSLYHIADIIGTMSTGNREYLLKHNPEILSEKIEIFPNTKKIIQLETKNRNNSLKRKYNIPETSTIFLFGGNMGKPQGVDVLCNAIVKLKHRDDIFFVLVGRGTEREKIRKYLQENNCQNVKQIDNLPRQEYEELLGESNVGIVMLNPNFTIPNYPSRILSYMEYGKPVLAATDNATDFKDLIQDANCGLWSNSSDVEQLIENIITLAENKEMQQKLGENGREYMKKNFNVTRSVDILEMHFNKGETNNV